MTYQYYCIYAPFGCDFARTRKNAIVKHNTSCTFRDKCEIYVNALGENKKLRQRIKNLENSMLVGRPNVELTAIDTDVWTTRFWDESDVRDVFCKLCPSTNHAVEGLICFLINTCDRFYKIHDVNTVDIIGKISSLDTFGVIEMHNLASVTQQLFNWASDVVCDHPDFFNLSEETSCQIHNLNPICNENHRIFIFNQMRADTTRRREGGQIKFRGVSI
jgi:hypothetical protein